MAVAKAFILHYDPSRWKENGGYTCIDIGRNLALSFFGLDENWEKKTMQQLPKSKSIVDFMEREWAFFQRIITTGEWKKFQQNSY